MIKLIATDVDGTLVKDSSPEIYPEMIDMIKKIREQGIIFCIAVMVAQGTVDPSPYYLIAFGPLLLTLVLQVVVSLATQKSDPPVPLMCRDGSVLKWEDLGENKFYVE